MKALRALASAALAGLVLAALAVPAAAADGDPQLSRGTPGCYNEPKIGLGANQGRCKVEVGFKPGTKLETTWIKATFPYSIWVNGQRKVQKELTIYRTGKKDGDGFYRSSRLEELATFQRCDKIELRYFKASVTWENPDTGMDEVVLTIPATTATETFPAGEDCSVSSDPQTTSATVASSQDPDDAGLLASSGSAEPSVLTAGGGVQPL